MSEFDLVIKDGLLVLEDQVIQSDLAINGEKIVGLGNGLEGNEEINASGLLVIPGGVDPHVHLQMPTPTTVTSDDWRSGSLAAASGGTTTVIDFVEPLVGQSMKEALQLRKMEADGETLIDYALHMTVADVSDETLSQIPEMIAEGVSSFKSYTTYTGLKLTYEELTLVMNAIALSGGLCMVHAEDDKIIRETTKKLLEEGKTTPQWFPLSRPPEAELEAVKRCIEMARTTKARLYVVHVSTSQAINAIFEARKEYVPVMGETCPQYLLLDQTQMLESDAITAAGLVCSPPLRLPVENQLLWNAINSGKFHSIGSDHCSFRLIPLKEKGLDDFRKVPGGLPGIELRYPLLYSFGVLKNKLSLQDWVNICSTQPSKIFGLYPKKGTLKIGSDADIVIFNPNKKVTVSQELLHENVDYSPYHSMELSGYPELTIVKGKKLITNGKLTTPQHRGKFLHCNLPNFL